MDFSAFSDDNFDVKTWVNNVLSTQEAKSNKDAYTSQLVMKLQMFIQEINHALEDASQHVLQTLPKLVRDAEAIKQDVSLLQSHMISVREDIAKVETDTANSMETLLTIDQIKSRVHASTKALKEADNWTTLSSDVEEVFLTGDLDSIAQKIQGMQQSLVILVDIPDYKDRQAHLENLKNRLETIVSPHLVNAIQSQSLDSAYIYVKVLRDIGRLSEIQKYYHGCQKSLLLQKWKEIIDSDSEQTLLNWITIYYDNLLSHWHSQMKWFSQVFPDLQAVDVLCGVFADSLSSLDPSVESCIKQAMKTQDEPLLLLIDLIQVVDRFSKSLTSIIRTHYSGSQEESLHKLAIAIYTPFLPHIKRYERYEQTLLLYKLGTVVLESDDVSDTISLIAETIMKIFGFAEEANTRCVNFSKGCCYPGFISALTVYFKNYTEKVLLTIQRWQANLKLDDPSITPNSDWAFLQQMLFAVQSCGEIVVHTNELEKTIAASLLTSMQKFSCVPQNVPDKKESFMAVDELLLEPAEQLRLKELVSKISDDTDSTDLLSDIKQCEKSLCESVTKLTFDTFFNEIKHLLADLPSLSIWHQNNPVGVLTSDLPTFGLAPQEYITKIGQYLMTIPQHIDPFILRDNPAIHVGFKLGKLPFSDGRELSQGEHVTDYLLNCIANKTCRSFVENIFKIDRVTTYAAKQLATDIEYLCNVFDDLDLHPTTDLMAIAALLKASPEEYKTCSEGKPAHIVSTIRGLRNLTHLES